MRLELETDDDLSIDIDLDEPKWSERYTRVNYWLF